MTSKVSIVISVYKPEKEVFDKVKEMLKKQTIKAEIIETWNMPEAKSMNSGIKRAKGDIVILLSQDCVPEDEFWLEKLIKPLENKEVIATTSDLYLPEWYWKKYPFLVRILTLNERLIRFPTMDARACAYRKKDLEDMGLFNEDPRIIAVEHEIYLRLKEKGKIVRAEVIVNHLHRFNNLKEIIKTIYNYSESNGKVIREDGTKSTPFTFWTRIIRATPFLGFLSMCYRFPFKKYFSWFPIFLLLAPINNVINVFGFWKGFFINEESKRNTIVLKDTNSPT